MHIYSFPSNSEIRKKWVQALITLNGQENTSNLSKTATICAKHFEENCFEKIGLSCVRLKPHSIPTLFVSIPTLYMQKIKGKLKKNKKLEHNKF